ncbi:hypothetical protein PVAND_011645 [Polypedilum vanderplanki]|uniref:HECT-type E3 ubiquitin transferase n=1 Tax=Polypedilum vanderplanki TaxID=319348 RepID=A0A9J6CJZ7_POLVA|nr:hypothetical protein PVAND_011645 [Polypedilum vanderplanki]
MSSLHFVVSIGGGDQLNDRIREVAEKINKYGTQTFPALHSLKIPVKQVVVGNSYLGVLLADGRAFRVAYSVIAERLDLSKQDSTNKNNGSGGSAGGNGTNNSGAGGSGSSSKNAQASSRQLARSTRARIMRTNGSSVRGQTSRSTGVIIGGTTSGRSLVHTVPATFVPEELISQAQVVLQGKSRNLIIRELQRTNLDVNLAVNNLLSRDDEEGEDTEEGSDNYVPEDLISLLDSGIHPDPSLLLDNDAMFSEDMRTFRNLMLSSRDRMQSSSSQSANQSDSNNLRTSGSSTVSAVVTSGSGSTSGTGASLSFGRIRDRTYFGPRRWFQSNREEVQWEKEQDSRSKMDTTASGFPLWISDDLEFWPDKDGTRFIHIASLYSEFIAVSTKGELHQWRWTDREPYRNSEFPNVHHPKVQTLALTYEKIVHISATTIRCSVVTESGKIATWIDEQLGYAGNKLEHQATSYPEFTLDKITSLHTCSLYTIARTESGELFWWGVLPFSQRKKMWEKYKAKSKKPQKKDKDKDSTLNEIVVGAQVCMKNIPMYQPGAIGFCLSNGIPKVGQLMNAAWDLMNICRFKILPMPQQMSTSSTLSSSISIEKESMTKITTNNSNSNSSGSTSSAGNKETADRMDMPPPPSPASSTCSDTSVSVKRKRIIQKDDSDNKKDEELWNLKDVVFVEDLRSVPIGKVLKVDGQYAAVRFQNSSSKDKFDESSVDAWQECRLLRKDELQLIKSATNSRVPDCIQKIPRRVVLNQQLNDNSQLLALTVDSKGIHTIMKSGQKLHYSLFNLSSGRLEKSSNFPTDLNSFMGKTPQNISLQCAGDQQESILILRDGNKTIYPLAKDCVEAVRDPTWMDLPPLSCIAVTPVTIQSTSSTKTQITLLVMATEQQLLMPKIMRCDVDAVKYFLQQLNGELKSQIQAVVQEFTDGNRNILHACITQCSPTSNKDSDQDLLSTANSNNNPGLECINTITNTIIASRTTSNIRDLMRRSSSTSALAGEVHHLSASNVSVTSADDNSVNLSYWQTEYDGNSGDEDSLSGIHIPKAQQQNQPTEIYISDPTERRVNALLSVQLICENAALQPYLRQLLSAKDATGQTPFMLAVSSRAYQAGIVLFDTILKIANGDPQIRDSMVFPNGSPDQSPLHVLCCNDTCSFTWTGADHINQDIFECQTCGLSGSLCCCTECAKVCHKGHDCKLKQTTPTAYCDCWQKCKCKALVAGNQTKRTELLEKLIKDTDLVMRFNSRGESILLFLIQTVGRQSIEQRQYRSTRVQQRNSGSYLNRKTPSIDADGEMPEHDLEPPRFARKALERLLGDWNAVRSMIQTGVESEFNLNTLANQVFYEDNDSKNLYINSQSGTIMLDKFTHILFFRCNNEPLDALLATLIKELQNDAISGRIEEAQKVARRFVRSVSRVFVIFSIEKSNNPDKQRNSTMQARLMLAFRRVFTSLLKFAIEELVEISDALIAPVRLGVVRPTAPFQLTSSGNNMDSDDLFSVEPLAPASRQNNLSDAIQSRIDSESTDGGFLLRISSASRNELDETNDPDAMVHDDGDISEQDDSQSVIHSRQNINNNNNNNVVDDVADDQMGQDNGGESDNEFNFQEAETESDSDDNQSTQDAGRSVQTGATAGSDTGLSNFVLINEDDTGDSSQQDEDGSEDGDSDEQSTEEFVLDDQLERRTTSSGLQRNNAPPHSLHWAIRSRDTTRTTSLHRLAGASNLVFIDPSAIRRSASANTVAQESPTMATTSSALARAFGIVLRQISELVGMLAWKFSCPSSNNYQSYDLSYQEAVQLQMYVERRLKPTWDWILTVMDATEAQLRFGASLTDSADSAHPLHPHNSNSNTSTSAATSNAGPPLNQRSNNRTVTIQMLTPNNSGSRVRDRNGTDSSTSRRDFLTYCLSLMRAHNSEHRDSLPVLDVTALRHVAFVLDSIIFYMRASNDLDCDRNDSNAWDDQDDNENEDVDDEFTSSIVMDTDSVDENDMIRPTLGKRHSFFQRSESTLCLGCSAPDPFNTPMAEAIPLAEQPQLLQPNARREDLFGMPKQAITVPASVDQITSSTLELPPIKLGLSAQSKDVQQNSAGNTNTVVISVTPSTSEQSQNDVIIPEEKQQLATVPQSKELSSLLKRPHSPQPGPSKGFLENYEDDDDESIDDEPQNLSMTKMNQIVDESKVEKHLYEDSDDSENENDIIRSPVAKKHRLMETGETIKGFSIGKSMKQADSEQDIDPSIRPPIIVVTRRNVADAIDAATANILSKNKKQTLSECVAPETPINFLPNNFVYEKGSEHEQSASSKSSVIVRVGPSTSSQVDPSLDTMDENQEVSANVTIETTNTPSQNQQIVQELPPRGVYFRSNITSDLLLGRWRLSLILFGRVFQEDVGMEPGSIISELGGFPVKEAKFRRHMEKLRNGQQRDLTLSKIDRARNCLIPQTFKELNTQYNNNNRRLQPPLAFNRVKVTFKDEPGEGSGVARSFYTLIAEALLSRENLPNLESAQVGSNKYNVPFSTMIRQRNPSGSSQSSPSVTIASNFSTNVQSRDLSEPLRRLTSKRTLWRNRDSRKVLLNYDARPFRPASEGGSNDHLSNHQQQLGERIYNKVYQIHPTQAAKITGMLLDLPPTQWIMLVSSDETLRQRANEAMALITFRHRMDRDGSSANSSGSGNNNNPQLPTVSLNITGSASLGSATLNIISTDSSQGNSSINAQQGSSSSSSQQGSKKLNPIVVLEDCQNLTVDDNAPLFYQPGKPNFYSPRQGYPSFERINAFRNVGRLIGLCLLQNELLPIFLQRHVLKYILGRQIRFHDLAFFDPIVYESLRQLVKDSQSKNGAQLLQSLELNFVIDLVPEEGGGSVELVNNGRDIIVNEQNVYDYVRKYAEYRMIKTQEKALEAIRSGVFDVLPETALDSLTAEDLRLLLNGVGDINVSVLSNYTSFNDESNESAEKLQRFKRWLWQIVERMTNLERQDLIYFWTGSPALPASEEGFQPMPTVTIRPADDAHLPTANTCISRLYIPLYSSKAVLRHKLLMAIKTKNFGFV